VNVKNGLAEVLAMETMSVALIQDNVAMSPVVVAGEDMYACRGGLGGRRKNDEEKFAEISECFDSSGLGVRH
jgi:hypothetical protein